MLGRLRAALDLTVGNRGRGQPFPQLQGKGVAPDCRFLVHFTDSQGDTTRSEAPLRGRAFIFSVRHHGGIGGRCYTHPPSQHQQQRQHQHADDE
jgi:hypothetical protein